MSSVQHGGDERRQKLMSFDPRIHVAFSYYLSGIAMSLMSRRIWLIDLGLPRVLPLGYMQPDLLVAAVMALCC